MKDEEARQITTMEAFRVADKKSQELTAKLIESERDKKSVMAALDVAEKQAEAQRKQLCQTKANLVADRDQVKILSKKLEEDEKAKDQVEQMGYDVGVAKTKKAFRTKVLEVCRHYCLQAWNKALNQARVEASSAFRRAESVYFPPAICASSSSGPKADTTSKEADAENESLAKLSLQFKAHSRG